MYATTHIAVVGDEEIEPVYAPEIEAAYENNAADVGIIYHWLKLGELNDSITDIEQILVIEEMHHRQFFSPSGDKVEDIIFQANNAEWLLKVIHVSIDDRRGSDLVIRLSRILKRIKLVNR